MTSQHWQLAREAAERYEQILVPSILGPFARALVDRAGLRAGDHVLDVGCGTGAAARFAAEAVGATGRVVGGDINAGMLEVARAASTSIEWDERSAYDLRYFTDAFEVVLCAQTLQFLGERDVAVAEMARVLKPGGRVAISCWTGIEGSPYFAALVDAIAKHVGSSTATGLNSAFALPSEGELRALLAPFHDVTVEVVQLDLDLARPSLAEFIPHHISATPMAAGYLAASGEAREAVVRDVVAKLPGARIPFRSHVATGAK